MKVRAPDGSAYQVYAGIALRVSRKCCASCEFGPDVSGSRKRVTRPLPVLPGISSLLSFFGAHLSAKSYSIGVPRHLVKGGHPVAGEPGGTLRPGPPAS